MHRQFARKSQEFPRPLSSLRSYLRSLISDSKLDFVVKEFEEQKPNGGKPLNPRETKPKFQISHQWPEWIDMMEVLLKKGYFEGEFETPFSGNKMGAKDANRIRTACLNFARDRFNLIRYLSRKDIHMVVGSGCPSIDRKVVNSGKRLRAHVGIDEGLVCSSCNLRGSCERAYVKARDDEGGRTVDVMRFVLTYGLDPFIGSVANKLCLNKSIKESVRRLLASMVELSTKEDDNDTSGAVSTISASDCDCSVPQKKGIISVPMKQGDWVCPKCNFHNFAKNIKCLRCDGLFQERLQKLREDQEHLPLKKGDWICATCNYINFRRNMVCLKCDWKRPRASINTDSSAQSHREERGFRQQYRVNFVAGDDENNNQSSIRHQRQIRNEGLNYWGGVQEGEDDIDAPSHGSPCYKSSKLEDFPIKGGKSVVSQNQQLWKEEVSKWRSELTDSQVHDRNLGFEVPDNSGLVESTTDDDDDDDDDDDMAGWFGGTKRRNRAVEKH
ncbi:hypothetical protein Sjap_024651 [Stephania japonica]|uniref:RanBP2-type domain-containing protein n=1 Tax=Stephania japonica TaxID=461633 RepID=A0AAP0EDZ6_9MAGN